MTTTAIAAIRPVRTTLKRSRPLVALTAVLLAVAGCGGGDESDTGDVAKVEAGVVALGTTQNVSCEVLEGETFGEGESTVFMCSFEEEKEQTGEMRPANRCFVLDAAGIGVVDVTVDLRARGSCPVISS